MSVTKIKRFVSYYSQISKTIQADMILSEQSLCAFEVGIKMTDVSFVAVTRISQKFPLELDTRIFYKLLDLLQVFFPFKRDLQGIKFCINDCLVYTSFTHFLLYTSNDLFL